MHSPGVGHVPHPSRRNFVQTMLVLPGVFLTSGCFSHSPLNLGGKPMSDTIIESVDDALSLSLEQLAERHGESFHYVDEVEPITYEPSSGEVGYTFCLAPDSHPDHYFTAMVVANAKTGKLSYDAESNFSQWLFKERAEQPYRRVLEQDEAAIGYATRIFYTHMDDKLWQDDQLETYMGEGGHGDPRVETFAVFDSALGRDEAVAAVTRIQAALWELDGSMCLTAVRRGADPREDWLYLTPSSKQLRSSRGDAPTTSEVEDIVELHYGTEDLQVWDGSATIGDPSLGSTLPEVTWKQ